MLKDARCLQKVYLACGYTDLRCGINALTAKIEYSFKIKPCQKNVLFLFCGKKNDRIKGLIWEGDGWLLLYKRLEGTNYFQWPRTTADLIEINEKQFEWLMNGLNIRQSINELYDPPKHSL